MWRYLLKGINLKWKPIFQGLKLVISRVRSNDKGYQQKHKYSFSENSSTEYDFSNKTVFQKYHSEVFLKKVALNFTEICMKCLWWKTASILKRRLPSQVPSWMFWTFSKQLFKLEHLCKTAFNNHLAYRRSNLPVFVWACSFLAEFALIT